ncbi:hypothetical protein [Aeromonas caviae]|nr:hypothetical protein [Aeromonas caviae]
MYQTRLRPLLRTLWFQLFWLTLILLGARVVMYHAFIDPAQLAGRGVSP